jgi:ABC transport system ATP-binding/permease protein
MLVFENGGLKEYVGGYDDWLRQRKVVDPPSVGSSKRSSTKNAKVTVTETAKKLSFKEKMELDQLPGRIEQMEGEQVTLHDRMAEPDYFRKPAEQQSKDHKRVAELEQLLVVAYARWEELSARV